MMGEGFAKYIIYNSSQKPVSRPLQGGGASIEEDRVYSVRNRFQSPCREEVLLEMAFKRAWAAAFQSPHREMVQRTKDKSDSLAMGCFNPLTGRSCN